MPPTTPYREQAAHEPRAAFVIPARIRLADFSQLRLIAWHMRDDQDSLTPEEALNLYERNWRHVDHDHLDPHERALIDALAQQLAGGRLLV